MKFIPPAVTRKVAQASLKASEKSPEILFGVGVAGMVTSTVLACRATLKVEEILDRVQHDINVINDMAERVDALEADDEKKEELFSADERKQSKTVALVRGGGQLALAYAPAVIVGVGSIFCLTKSHNILQERNLALTAAYAAVDGAFHRYRDRVIERFGPEIDEEIRFESEEVTVVDDETGEVVTTMRVTGGPGNPYMRWYAEWSSKNYSVDPEINLMNLRNIQNIMNDKLKTRGHVFLNEVYEALGLTHTRAGAAVGWRRKTKGGLDGFIDFGIWDGDSEAVNDFFRGKNDCILLDFNVDGPIWDVIEEVDIGRGEFVGEES